jgi:hypothetical protein
LIAKGMGANWVPIRSLFSAALSCAHRRTRAKCFLAYAVSTPLIGGGVAEWLKAAVC